MAWSMSELQEFVITKVEEYQEAGLLNKLAKKAQLDYATMLGWTEAKSKPNVASIESALDAMGYDLILRKRDPNTVWF